MSFVKRFLEDETLKNWPFTPLFEKTFENLTEEFSEFEEETFECIKGDVKTIITCKFNKFGHPLRVSTKTEIIPVPKEEKLSKLKAKLQEAIDKKDWVKAGEIQKEIDKL